MTLAHGAPLTTLLSSVETSFPALSTEAKFGYPKPAPVKRIDFPIKPYLLKYLEVALELPRLSHTPHKLADFVLCESEKQFGLVLSLLLRKPAKSARHNKSIDDCTASLGVDLSNYNFSYYDLAQNKPTPYTVFQFNGYIERTFRKEVLWWVKQHCDRGMTIKDAIRSCMVFYDVTEDELPYETLRKMVQRKTRKPAAKKSKKNAPKTGDFSMNLSQKTDGLS